MPRTIGLFLLVIAVTFTGCASSDLSRKTRTLNEEQFESLTEIQKKQLKIRTFVERVESVDHAEVFLREAEIVVFLYFRSGRLLSLKERDAINSFVTQETGIGRENIRLMVKKQRGN